MNCVRRRAESNFSFFGERSRCNHKQQYNNQVHLHKSSMPIRNRLNSGFLIIEHERFLVSLGMLVQARAPQSNRPRPVAPHLPVPDMCHDFLEPTKD